jgi:uncharacterized surface anchored protein
VKETKAPEGYVLEETPLEFDVTFEGDATECVIAKSVFDERKKVELKLKKNDGSEALAGARFGLFAADEIKAFEGTVLAEKDALLKEAVSGSDGKIDFAMDLPAGKYYVKEIKAPEGFVLGSDVYEIDATTGKLKGTKTVFTHAFSNEAVKGRLEILKEGEGLVSFDEEGFHYEKHSLEGAEFDLFRVVRGQAEEAAEQPGEQPEEPSDEQTEAPAGHYVTDSQGSVIVENLELGTYKLVETKAPYGMETDATPIEIKVEYKDQNTPVVVVGKNIYNTRKKVNLTVNKYRSGTEEKLSGGEFELYCKNDIVNYKGEVIAPADTLLATTEAVEGVIDFGLDLPEGDYYIIESKAIEGYKKMTEPVDFRAGFEEACVVDLYNEIIPPKTPVNEVKEQLTAVKGAFVNYITEDFGGSDTSVLIGGIAAGLKEPSAPAEANERTADADNATVGLTGQDSIAALVTKVLVSFLTGTLVAAMVLLVLDIRNRHERRHPDHHSHREGIV